MTHTQERLLAISNLRTYFYTYEGIVKALDGVDLAMDAGDSLGLVGETGCGKSTVALSLMRLIRWPPGKIVEGSIVFRGQELLKKNEDEMRTIRGRDIAMIFQEPMTSLNPVYKIEKQILDIMRLHEKLDKKQAESRAIETLKLVGLPDPDQILKRYPHELSGGMRQKVMIAMALSCRPDLLIADEPTSALDVTIQVQILALIKDLLKNFKLSLLMITHDLGVVAETCNKVAVMYAGHVVEYGRVDSIFQRPRHPYTQGLMDAIPKPTESRDRLEIIQGSVPNLISPPEGCRFHPRCEYATNSCKNKRPDPIETEQDHYVFCSHK
jgi:peptide/nickel transport system ATP-binding protein/oligopeptide transport system ATP-binding protein